MRLRDLGRARLLAAVTMMLSLGAVPGTQESADAAGDACGATVLKADGTAWACSFVDNFDGWKLDATKWVVLDTATSGFRVGDTCFKAGQGVAVGGGTLRLTVQRRTPFSCQSLLGDLLGQASYTGGGVSSWGKFSQTYGRFETRMKFPAYTGPGLHGGFWMNPKNRDYGLWPASGEIDVAEFFSGVAQNLFPSLHYAGSTRSDSGFNCPVTRVDLFHTYTVVWGPRQMDFSYDGKLCFSRTWSPLDLLAPAPFDRPFVLALLASTGMGTNAPTAALPATNGTQVDYVKVWR